MDSLRLNFCSSFDTYPVWKESPSQSAVPESSEYKAPDYAAALFFMCRDPGHLKLARSKHIFTTWEFGVQWDRRYFI
jgi:hypothetical protein